MPNYFGDCNPGESAHSLRCAAVSACRALRSSSSFSAPGRRREASCRAARAKSASRSLNDNFRSKRRRSCMARSFPFQRKAGAQRAFSSQIKATYRAVIAAKQAGMCLVPNIIKLGPHDFRFRRNKNREWHNLPMKQREAALIFGSPRTLKGFGRARPSRHGGHRLGRRRTRSTPL